MGGSRKPQERGGLSFSVQEAAHHFIGGLNSFQVGFVIIYIQHHLREFICEVHVGLLNQLHTIIGFFVNLGPGSLNSFQLGLHSLRFHRGKIDSSLFVAFSVELILVPKLCNAVRAELKADIIVTSSSVFPALHNYLQVGGQFV